MKVKESKTKYSFWISLAIWICIWAIPACFMDSLICPGPGETLKALFDMSKTPEFWLDTGWTLIRCILGVVVSFTIGAMAAMLSHKKSFFRVFLKIPVSFFKSVPVMAIIIYVILIAKSDWVAIIVCFLMCFPIAYTNILAGLDNLKKEYRELAFVYNLNRKETFRIILRPEIQPYVSSALNLITGMSFKVVVASEILAIPDYSIGYEMMNAKYYLETADLFAYIVVLIVLSLITETLVKKFTAPNPDKLHESVAEAVKREESGRTYETEQEDTVILRDISKSYDDTPVFDNFNVRLSKGVTALLAPSGKGKTTLAGMIAGLESPQSGEITVNSSSISYLFQEDRLLPWLKVYDNMALGLAGKGIRDTDEIIADMADKLEIKDVLDMKPAELSGGMAHRVSLGRTLLRDADLMILDEPFRGLDEALRDRIIDRIRDDLTKDRTVLLITHDRSLAENLSDRIIEL